MTGRQLLQTPGENAVYVATQKMRVALKEVVDAYLARYYAMGKDAWIVDEKNERIADAIRAVQDGVEEWTAGTAVWADEVAARLGFPDAS